MTGCTAVAIHLAEGAALEVKQRGCRSKLTGAGTAAYAGDYCVWQRGAYRADKLAVGWNYIQLISILQGLQHAACVQIIPVRGEYFRTLRHEEGLRTSLRPEHPWGKAGLWAENALET